VAGITIPLNIIIGFFLMYMADFSLNMSTLIAIGMSVGILVTDSMVVLETILKRLEETNDPEFAAIQGTSDCTVEVLASTGTNIVVLFPISMMQGTMGLFLRPLALTMLQMTAVSLFLSFTLIPLLASVLLTKKVEGEETFLQKVEARFNAFLNRIIEVYQAILRVGEKHAFISILILVATVGMLIQSLPLAGKVGGSFFPIIDKGELTIRLEFPTNYSLKETTKRTLEARKLLEGIEGVKQTLVTVGTVEGGLAKISTGVNLAEIFMKFSERDEREVLIHDIRKVVDERLKNFPDALITTSIPGVTGGSQGPIQLEISGPELGTLDTLVSKVKAKVEAKKGFISLDSSVRPGKPKLNIIPKREVLSQMNMEVVNLGSSLRGNLEGLVAATFKKGARNYDIKVKLSRQEGKGQVSKFSFEGANGKTVPMTGLGQIQEIIAPIQIVRKDKQRISKLESYLDQLPLGLAVNKVSKAIKDIGLPPGYSYFFAGPVEMMGEAQAELGQAAIIAFVLVILTLAAIMESVTQPALILTTVPLSIIGMLWALYVSGNSISIFVIMGGIMLMGIVVNNAILILDHFNHLVAEGMDKSKAMIKAAGDRFKPIIMITLSAVLGMIPMALTTGIGAELRNDVGAASAGGILSSGILALFVVPILYNLIVKVKDRILKPARAGEVKVKN
jgi:HAE1 family hydrophobic/amphiphilic exporter-1